MKDYITRIMMYKSSLQIAKDWLRMGLITKKEFSELSVNLSNKYGVDLCSIFFESSG